MIRFQCPRCKGILESPDQKAGDKVNCPKCQQRLQVPGLPREKTILAASVPNPPSPSSPAPPQAIPVLLEEIPNQPNRKNWKGYRRWVFLTCACLLFVPLSCGLLYVGKSIFGSKVTDSVQKDDLQMTV